MTRCPAPNRLMINLVGVRDIDFDSLSESLLETSAVQDAYRMMAVSYTHLPFLPFSPFIRSRAA